MFSKLSLRNVRRSVRDYAVYFMTLTFGVCLFYTFNALDSQNAMAFLSGSQRWEVDSILEIVAVFSVFVTVVLAGLILYANRFLMKRRKRELGTYFLLGMDAGQVSRVLVRESLVIGLAALLLGSVLGVLGSWCLDRLTLAMFLAVPQDLFVFRVSWKSILKTSLYFGAIFLLVMVFTGVSVSRSRLIDLIYGGRRNEEIPRRSLGFSVFLFVLGCLLLAAAYAMLLIRGLLRIDRWWFFMLFLGTAGTFLLFRSLSGFLLRLTKGHPGYYKGLNMFVLRQWSGRVHTESLSNTVISILLLLAMGVTACSVGLNDTITASSEAVAPYDCTILNYSLDSVGELDPLPFLREAGIDPDRDLSRLESVTVYYNDEALTGIVQPTVYALIPLSAYNAIMAGRGLKKLTEAELSHGLLTPEAIVNGPASNGVMVVSDALTPQLEPRRQMINIDYASAGDAQAADQALRQAVQDISQTLDMDVQGNYKLDSYYDLMGSKILVLYLGLYLGLAFLLTAAAVLALQQLSQAADNARRYQLLARLGAPEGMRRRALVRQVALAFLLPLGLGMVHAAVGMRAANEVIRQVGRVDALRSSLLTAGVLLVIYGGYFLCTCLGAWRAVRGGQTRRE